MFYKNQEDDGWKLLEQITINDRSLVAWYNPNTNDFNLALFHLTDQPNKLSQHSTYSTWGYVTKLVGGMMSESEAAEVVSLYLQDIKKAHYWWEKDG